MKQILGMNRLLIKPLKWQPLEDSDRDFITDKYPKEKCFLRMNDFPEEPLWTLFYNGDSIDFDDTPLLWKVYYRE